MPVSLVMMLRWLALTITIAGAIPVRICTCGASLHLHDLSPWETQRSTPSRLTPVTADFSVLIEGLQPLVEHDPDCHLVRPRPLMAPGVLPPPVEAPDDTALVLIPQIISTTLLLDPGSVAFWLDLHPPPLLLPSVSLHLTLCQFRN
jgi:hypothetical protein